MNISKTAIVISKLISTLELLAGWFLLIIFSLCTLGYFTDKAFQAEVGTSFLVFCIVMNVIAIILIAASRSRSKLINEFKKYVSIISASSTGSILNLSQTVGIPEEEVKEKLELMIKRKYFVSAYIDQVKNCLVIGNMPSINYSQSIMGGNQPSEIKIEYISCTCKSCGGANKVIKGQSGVCDFCGTPINCDIK